MDDVCAICLDAPVDPMSGVRCKHVFCTVCLGAWMGIKGTCPVCRALLEKDEEREKPAAEERAPHPPPLASTWWICVEWTIVMIMCFIVMREAYSILRGMATEADYEKKGAPEDRRDSTNPVRIQDLRENIPEGRRESANLVCTQDFRCPQARDECEVIVCAGGTCEAQLKGECASDADCQSVSGLTYACDREKCACYNNSYDDTTSFSKYTPARVALLGDACQTAAPWFVYRASGDVLEIVMQLNARVYSPAAVVVNIANTPYNIDTSRYYHFAAHVLGADIRAEGLVVNATAIRINFGPPRAGDNIVINGHFVGQYTRA